MSTLQANGATQTIYILEIAGTVYYKINEGSATNISWPLTIVNLNPGSSSILKVIFTTNISLNSTTQYFICGSTYIQFGSTSLNSDGSQATITIDNVTGYPGVVKNGADVLPSPIQGNGNIYIYNIKVSSNSSSLIDGGGWITQNNFGRGASSNIIVNCSSDGPIPLLGGGIVGESAGCYSGEVILRGCSSSGAIDNYGGGIVGHYGGNTGSVTCENCWSTGTIGTEGGGIFGDAAGINSGSASATNCYSQGTIGTDGGGIYGSYAAENAATATAEKCYSMGTISVGGGGIFGKYAGNFSGSTTASNCYSSGSFVTTGTGIFGSNKQNGSEFNCYSSNNSWSDFTANTSLTGTPSTSNVGSVWIKVGTNVPYELNAIGYTPYTVENIDSSSELIQTYSQTIAAGETSNTAVISDASGNSFTILQKSNGVPDSYSTITMSSQTGAISTTSSTAPGTYTILLRSTGSYNITTFTLTVIAAILNGTGATTLSCCYRTLDLTGIDYVQRNQIITGNTLIGSSSQKYPISYMDIYSMKMAYAAKR